MDKSFINKSLYVCWRYLEALHLYVSDGHRALIEIIVMPMNEEEFKTKGGIIYG